MLRNTLKRIETTVRGIEKMSISGDGNEYKYKSDISSNLRRLKDLPPFAKKEIKQQLTSIHKNYGKECQAIYARFDKDLAKLHESGKSSSDTSTEAQELVTKRDRELEEATTEWKRSYHELNALVLGGTQEILAGLSFKIADRRTNDFLRHKVENAEQKNKQLENTYKSSRAVLEEKDRRAWELFQKVILTLRDNESLHSASQGDHRGSIDRDDDGGHEMAHRKIAFGLYAKTLSSARDSRPTQEQAKRVGKETSREIRVTEDFQQTLRDLNDHKLSPEERKDSVNRFIEKHLPYHPRLSSADASASEPSIIDKPQALFDLAREQPGKHTAQQETAQGTTDRPGNSDHPMPYSEEERQAREEAFKKLVKDYTKDYASEKHIHATAARNFSEQVAATLTRLEALENDHIQRPDKQREIAQARQGIYHALAAIRHLSPEVGAEIKDIYTKFKIEESSPSTPNQPVDVDQRFEQAYQAFQEGRKEAPVAQLDLSHIDLPNIEKHINDKLEEKNLKFNDLANHPEIIEEVLEKLAPLGEIKEGSEQHEENSQEYQRLVALIEKKYASQLRADENAYKQASGALPTDGTSRSSYMSKLFGGTQPTNHKDNTDGLNKNAPVAEGSIIDRESLMGEAKEKWEQTLAQREAEIATIDHFYKPMTLGRVSTQLKEQLDQLKAAVQERDKILTKMGGIQAEMSKYEAFAKKYGTDPSATIAELEQKLEGPNAKLQKVNARLDTAKLKQAEIEKERNRYRELTNHIEKEVDLLGKNISIKRHEGAPKEEIDSIEMEYNRQYDLMRVNQNNLRIIQDEHNKAISAVLDVEGEKNAIQAEVDAIEKDLTVARKFADEIDHVHDNFQSDARKYIGNEHARYLHFIGMRDRTRQLALMAFAVSFGGGANDILQQIAVSGYMPLMGMLLR
ncbi:hypothetical protein [Dictyobacter aurantiacus]|uniref:Uncharacterized protein n=1 Tax=Dictyobacter aurantiacus TaxID=1936993 RepID=A0A401Z9F8_9CHLR|nr:hypothetical protein [Dictyobacter aurantiacus]GCE03485.1 hypothetical protein KDAU_08140 [Dictyobacter aurantiacus]